MEEGGDFGYMMSLIIFKELIDYSLFFSISVISKGRKQTFDKKYLAMLCHREILVPQNQDPAWGIALWGKVGLKKKRERKFYYLSWYIKFHH